MALAAVNVFPVALALASLLLLLPPAVAGAVPPPSPVLLPVLAARCDSAGFLRIDTARSTLFTHRVRLEADAVVLSGPKRVAIVELGRMPEDRDRRIPWAEVEQLSLGRSHTGEGALVGVLAGAAIGGALLARNGPDGFESGDHFIAVLAAASTITLGALGALIGSASYTWTPLHP